jgi:hypothetical protein
VIKCPQHKTLPTEISDAVITKRWYRNELKDRVIVPALRYDLAELISGSYAGTRSQYYFKLPAYQFALKRIGHQIKCK